MTRIGIIDLASDTWTAGGAYSHVAAQSLARAVREGHSTVEVFLMSSESTIPGTERISTRTTNANSFGTKSSVGAVAARILEKSESIFGRKPMPIRPNPIKIARSHGLQALFPVTSVPRYSAAQAVAKIAWIPDFQHVYMPELFTERELLQRSRNIQRLVTKCDAVVLSSETVGGRFCEALPEPDSKGSNSTFSLQVCIYDTSILILGSATDISSARGIFFVRQSNMVTQEP